jgi:hypothetical protein
MTMNFEPSSPSAASRTKCHKVIVALTVQDILEEQIARKLA